MKDVDPSKRARFCIIFLVVAQDITEVFSAIIDAANGHWMMWAKFCQYVSLNPLLVLYRYPVEPSPPEDVRYDPAQLRTPCGLSVRHLPLWGTHTPASQAKAS